MLCQLVLPGAVPCELIISVLEVAESLQIIIFKYDFLLQLLISEIMTKFYLQKGSVHSSLLIIIINETWPAFNNCTSFFLKSFLRFKEGVLLDHLIGGIVVRGSRLN